MSGVPVTDKEFVEWIHNQARRTGNTFFHEVANRFSELAQIVESLDPAERSWYYDGDGTKRKKDE